MSSDVAEMGGILDLLSDPTRRMIAVAEAHHRKQAARDAKAAEVRHEDQHRRALEAFAESAARRDEDIAATDLIMGKVAGRTVQQVLDAAVAAAAEQDRAEAYRGPGRVPSSSMSTLPNRG